MLVLYLPPFPPSIKPLCVLHSGAFGFLPSYLPKDFGLKHPESDSAGLRVGNAFASRTGTHASRLGEQKGERNVEILDPRS